MRSWIIFLGLLFTTFTQAQVITGRVTDLNNHPIELAVVIIQTNDSVYVNSTYTDSLGSFSVKAEISPFLLTVQHLLYETYQSTYDSLTIGNIQLNEKSQTLSEVSVTGERPLAKVVDGKITYSMPHLLKDKMAVSAYRECGNKAGKYNLPEQMESRLSSMARPPIWVRANWRICLRICPKNVFKKQRSCIALHPNIMYAGP